MRSGGMLGGMNLRVVGTERKRAEHIGNEGETSLNSPLGNIYRIKVFFLLTQFLLSATVSRVKVKTLRR